MVPRTIAVGASKVGLAIDPPVFGNVGLRTGSYLVAAIAFFHKKVPLRSGKPSKFPIGVECMLSELSRILLLLEQLCTIFFSNRVRQDVTLNGINVLVWRTLRGILGSL